MSEAHPKTVDRNSTEPQRHGAVLDFIAAKQRRIGAVQERYFLSTSADSDRVELTSELFDVLKIAAHAFRRGQSVSIHRRDQEITTQGAAEILGISRPTVVKLIKAGALPASVPGTERRKLRLSDVLRYRENLHEERSEFISDSAVDFEDYATDDLDEVMEEVREQTSSPAV